MGIELYLEEVSFDQSINGDSLVKGLLIPFSRNGKGTSLSLKLKFTGVNIVTVVLRGSEAESKVQLAAGIF